MVMYVNMFFRNSLPTGLLLRITTHEQPENDDSEKSFG